MNKKEKFKILLSGKFYLIFTLNILIGGISFAFVAFLKESMMWPLFLIAIIDAAALILTGYALYLEKDFKFKINKYLILGLSLIVYGVMVGLLFISYFLTHEVWLIITLLVLAIYSFIFLYAKLDYLIYKGKKNEENNENVFYLFTPFIIGVLSLAVSLKYFAYCPLSFDKNEKVDPKVAEVKDIILREIQDDLDSSNSTLVSIDYLNFTEDKMLSIMANYKLKNNNKTDSNGYALYNFDYSSVVGVNNLDSAFENIVRKSDLSKSFKCDYYQKVNLNDYELEDVIYSKMNNDGNIFNRFNKSLSLVDAFNVTFRKDDIKLFYIAEFKDANQQIKTVSYQADSKGNCTNFMIYSDFSLSVLNALINF